MLQLNLAANLDGQDERLPKQKCSAKKAAREQASAKGTWTRQTDFSRIGFIERLTLDYAFPKSHFASCTEYATENVHIK